MGYVFWYLGNGSQIEILPRSAGVFHREYIAGFRLEEISINFDNLILNIKGGYLTGIELVDENANRTGTYYAAFTGLNFIYLNSPLPQKGWKFGAGLGVLTSKIHTYVDYAGTINGAVVGNLENGEVLLLIENLGFGKTIPAPSVYFRGLSNFQNFTLGPFLRFYGGADLDAGFVFISRYGLFNFIASPSLKNAIVGFSVESGNFRFRYDYEYYWIGYSTHRLGFNILWGKQKELEEKIERHEELLAEHEKEIRGLKDRISKLENSAADFARNLLESAKKDPDPQSALTKVRIAMVFDTSQTVKRMEDSLTNLISQADKEIYIKRINLFLRNNLYSDALAEALVFLENYPQDRDALRVYNQVKGEVEKQKEANKIKEETNRKFESGKIQRIENLISKGDYVSASKLVSTLPEGPDKIRFSNTLRRTAEEYLRKAKELIANKDWVQAKYYIEKSMKIYPLPESPGLLSYVESNIKASSETLYLKSLELYQKGDIQGAYAYIKEAIRLDPNNEKYRNVYYRLGNVLKED